MLRTLKKKVFKVTSVLKFKERKRRNTKKRNVGKTKALLIGINYRGTRGELYGCINDVEKIGKLLSSHGCDEMMILTEDDLLQPTRENIRAGLEWLVRDSENYDKVILHYSGHGSWMKDVTGDEDDNRDECLVPLDYRTRGMISDDEIHDNILSNLKCPMFAIVDACHSGSILDLEHKYFMDTHLKSGFKYNMKNWSNNYNLISGGKTILRDKPKIVMISGCKDEQTSADAWLDGKSQGALTYTFYEVLRYNRSNISIQELMKQIHANLILKGFAQRPVISSNERIRMQNKFELL